MDIPIKLKAFEIEALDELNKKAPEVYQGKKQGFYWALHQAAIQKDTIEWEKVAEFKLDKFFNGERFESCALSVSHLTADDDDYSVVEENMNLAFSLKRSVKKAYLARNVIKWGIIQIKKNEIMETTIAIECKSVEVIDYFELSAEVLNGISDLIRCQNVSKLEKIKQILDEQ